MKGKIIKISSDIIEVRFSNEIKIELEIGKILYDETKDNLLLIEKIISENLIRAIIISSKSNLYINQELILANSKLKVPVGENTKGNIFNIKGESLNNPNLQFEFIDMDSTINKQNFKNTEKVFLETGIKVIDFFTPIFKGAKLGIFGGAGVGKTILMKELIFNLSNNKTNSDKKITPIFIGSGERIREGQELLEELKEAQFLDKSIVFISQMNETPGSRNKIIPYGITAAEYLRDNNKEDILLFIDNIYRFIQAGNELSASLGKKPSSAGYQPTLNSEVAYIEERLNQNQNGSITSFQTVFLPMDDINDPGSTAVFSHLDSVLVLSRDIASSDIFPAFDALNSNSNLTTVENIGEKHFHVLSETKRILQKYNELKEIILILGIENLDYENWVIAKKALQLINFFSQKLNAASNFIKEKGDFVPLKDTIESVKKINEGLYLKRDPEEFFYIKSTNELLTDEELDKKNA
ncbi:MSC_0618 family F1-like ATPase beta subunit [Mesomycoplasma molare]|uniref:F0F1 ATP synthase subunit beta n=1 Tax=Mesomycoplasma molare TaxID=171288 RepID=A0ABY5TYE7_9BACT|nr:F0F1 ATP synthase subunit beta [Mesomycoplasma molare]